MTKATWGLIAAFAGVALQGIVLAIGFSQAQADTASKIAVLQAQVANVADDVTYIKRHYMDMGFSKP